MNLCVWMRSGQRARDSISRRANGAPHLQHVFELPPRGVESVQDAVLPHAVQKPPLIYHIIMGKVCVCGGGVGAWV